MIDLHSHILPGLDDGAADWDESLEMARMAVADGIQTIVATPHLFQQRVVELSKMNHREVILDRIEEFKTRLRNAHLDLTIVPGCDFPLSFESLQLLKDDQILTINDGKRYLLLEFPDTSLPPATEDIFFRLNSQGIMPIITHPERHLVFQEMPNKLARLISLGCLVQLTAASLTGGFGRQAGRAAREMLSRGYAHILATDAHSPRNRPPRLSEAVEAAASLVGRERALAMVTEIPQRILNGERCY